MPIVVDPGFSWPPEVDPVVSPDGKLMAIVDPAHAGVLLRADFDDSVPDTPAVPEKVLRRNLAQNPSFTTTDSLSGNGTITAGGGATVAISNEWSSSGTTSLKISGGTQLWTAAYPIGASSSSAGLNQAVGKTYTVAADFYLPERQTGGIDTNAREIQILYRNSANTEVARAFYAKAPNEAGKHRVVVAGTIPEDSRGWAIRIVNGSMTTAMYVDSMTIEEGVSSGTYFDGSTSPTGAKKYRWAGPVNASASEEFTPATPFVPGHDATTAKVRFERQDGSVVRSGNPAWAPGGYAHAYDHEATLGGGTLWRAVPIRFDGTEGEPSEYVGAVIPALTDGWAWLKPVTDPDKAMLLKVEPPDLSYDGRVDTTSIAGAPRPAATWDVLEGFTTQLRSLLREKDVEEQLMALLDEGPVLAQFPACAGLPDFYFIRGKLDLEHVHWDGWPWRRYQWDVVQIDRPDTTDSPLRIPGLSYDTVARDWTTYDQLAATVESYNMLLEP